MQETFSTAGRDRPGRFILVMYHQTLCSHTLYGSTLHTGSMPEIIIRVTEASLGTLYMAVTEAEVRIKQAVSNRPY